MDISFDIMNIRDIHSDIFDLKPSLVLFSSVDNPKLQPWLRSVFLQYFKDWLANSIIEVTKILLQHEVANVLTLRFSQNLLENYFGR